MSSKLELIIESILNEDEAKAKALFHEFVVQRSREIYESLMDEEMGGNQAQGFVQDLTQQDDAAGDMGLGEDDLEGGDIDLDGGEGDGEFGGADDSEGFGGEETFGDDGEGFGGEEGEHEEITSKLDDLEAQLAELKSLLGGEEEGGFDGEGEGEEGFGGEEEGGFGGGEGGEESDFDMDGGEEGSGKSGSGSAEDLEEAFGKSGSGMSGSGKSGSGKSGSGKMESANPFAKSGSGKSGSGKSGSGKSGSGKSGSGKTESYVRKTEAEIMKEYVDKIGEIYKQEPASGEGKTVGTGGDEPNVNHKSISLDKGPDFGGTNENILSGKGNEQAADGKAFKAPKNEYSKGQTEQPLANKNGGYKNKVGGNTPWNQKAPSDGHGADKKSGQEGKTVGTGGDKPGINDKGLLGGKSQPTGKK
jgi:hypothetical protein